MPLERSKDSKGPFYRWGDKGAKYRYTAGDPAGRGRAKEKALAQGRAIAASRGRAGGARPKLEVMDPRSSVRLPDRPSSLGSLPESRRAAEGRNSEVCCNFKNLGDPHADTSIAWPGQACPPSVAKAALCSKRAKEKREAKSKKGIAAHIVRV